MFNNIITQLCLVTPTLTQICTFACCYQARSQKHKMKKKRSNILNNDKDKWVTYYSQSIWKIPQITETTDGYFVSFSVLCQNYL